MKTVLRYTLISDGPTDANLIPIINWVLSQGSPDHLYEGVRAEFWRLPHKPENLVERLIKAVDLYPCDILFVHRDAEKEPPDDRVAEIRRAYANASQGGVCLPAVAVVPVRMSEAWMLFDEQAIRKAAGNPNGTSLLDLPSLRNTEAIPDPKEKLRRALETASELSGRRLKKFNTSQAFWRVVEYIDDFSRLRELSAFRKFEASVAGMCQGNLQPGLYA